ncbi:flagellar basal body rod protein [Methylobacterium sp. 4-46]|uniref:flagellar basal-body rod protein FlgF n=1 Tax=unclassified Methylobacterium TaxID=2615210 RepID=UPI000152C416|nr:MULTISPECIES: flagellar basal-body rod protein FlgF [Methylobacterium]ACA20762.1 flagellar basal body rod protein [Methylobacterium sp. 4-46]WFT79914.1 flagellar basal-body rod protein FlgF [Methylobacterium nodulans]
MQNGLYVSLSAQVALQKRLDTVANNIANLATVGYRAEETKFEAVFDKARTGPVAFASTGDTYISRLAGPTIKTDAPLDVAVQGDAWLSVQGPGGAPVYTRDGRMTMDASGQLRSVSGQPILDPGGAPILLDPNAGPPTIGRDGSIQQNGSLVGSLGVFTLDAKSRITRAGPGAVTSNLPARPVQDFTKIGVVQGHLEGANVNPILEMTKLIAIQRAFDNAVATASEADSSLQSAIRTLGPTG